MKIDVETRGTTLIIKAAGKLVGGEDGSHLIREIRNSLAHGTKLIVLDLTELTWFSSVGLGVLISVLTLAKNSDARLVLTGIHQVESTLTITRLINVFETYDSVQDALNASA